MELTTALESIDLPSHSQEASGNLVFALVELTRTPGHSTGLRNLKLEREKKNCPLYS